MGILLGGGLFSASTSLILGNLREDIGSIIDDCRQVSAEGYFLACSTQPSASLITKLKEIAEKPENRLVTLCWDGVELEKRLTEPRCFSLGHLFFPQSFAALEA